MNNFGRQIIKREKHKLVAARLSIQHSTFGCVASLGYEAIGRRITELRVVSLAGAITTKNDLTANRIDF